MTNTLSAAKNVRKSKVRQGRNRKEASRLKKGIEQFDALVANSAEEAKKLWPKTAKLIDQSCAKKVLAKNRARKLKSKLMRMLNELTEPKLSRKKEGVDLVNSGELVLNSKNLEKNQLKNQAGGLYSGQQSANVRPSELVALPEITRVYMDVDPTAKSFLVNLNVGNREIVEHFIDGEFIEAFIEYDVRHADDILNRACIIRRMIAHRIPFSEPVVIGNVPEEALEFWEKGSVNAVGLTTKSFVEHCRLMTCPVEYD